MKDGVCIICGLDSPTRIKRGRLVCQVSEGRWSGYAYRYNQLIDRNICNRCGFTPENKCQIDVDHIDGNHSNNALENLQALCANCHRLKTFGLT